MRTMVDMAKTPDDVKKELKDYPQPVAASGDASVPAYPYGLCMSWDEEVLAKLGMTNNLPKVGDMIHVAMMAKVTSVSESERETSNGEKKKCCRIELQGTHVGVEDETTEYEKPSREERIKRRYDEGSD